MRGGMTYWSLSDLPIGAADTLAARVVACIRYNFRTVNQAAKAWGVPQQSLRRIALGLSLHPKADVLDRIARANGTCIEWFLTGEAKGSLPPKHVLRQWAAFSIVDVDATAHVFLPEDFGVVGDTSGIVVQDGAEKIVIRNCEFT